ncbi:MAG: replication initiation protein [Bacilli bacterium]
MAGRKNRKSIQISNSDSIQKSTDFSMAKMNQGLTLNQMQLLAYAIFATQKDKSTNFIKADFEKKFELDEYRTERAKEDVRRLMDIKFSFEDLSNDEFMYWNVFSSIQYKEGTFQFKWTEDMLPNILDLKEKYVRTDLSITAQFKSNFSWTLYDYLRAKYGCWYITFTKEELMKIFGVENKGSYQNNTGLFKKYVLDIAINEVNFFTELDVKYEEIKEGRAIIGFKIFWSTGSGVHKASKKQMDNLIDLAEIVFQDAFMYLEIKDEINRERAVAIIRDLQTMKYTYLDTELGLTADRCRELTRIASDDLEALNSLLEMEGKKPLGPQVPLFNWLIDK